MKMGNLMLKNINEKKSKIFYIQEVFNEKE
jgi:hypothetical protein